MCRLPVRKDSSLCKLPVRKDGSLCETIEYFPKAAVHSSRLKSDLHKRWEPNYAKCQILLTVCKLIETPSKLQGNST